MYFNKSLKVNNKLLSSCWLYVLCFETAINIAVSTTVAFASLQVFQASTEFCSHHDSIDHGGGNSGEPSDDCGAHQVPKGQKCGGSLHYQVSSVLLFLIR